MKDRLNQLIKTEGLTPSLFADKLGINRPTVSHVLTGRNNPGYDFIQKILVAFPKLNAEWLLLGNGDMYKHHLPEHHHHLHSVSDLFAHPDKPAHSAHHPPSSPTLLDHSAIEKEDVTLADDKKNVPSDEGTEISTATKPQKIERIVVLYSDKTFLDYAPA
ncbi:MAG: helix-turn-helix domain-containing protein [Bacteroidales bacterium]|jgi:transcriptional regulator with XRE-family HTH domain|nr:helix-turn-helix domain-containing protein [Bacteroidales bacterium]